MDKLPSEILLKIFHHVNVFDLSRNVPNVNHQWRNTVNILWKQMRRLEIYKWATGGINSEYDVFKIMVKGKHYGDKRISSKCHVSDDLHFILKKSSYYLKTLHFNFIDLQFNNDTKEFVSKPYLLTKLRLYHCSESFVLSLLNNAHHFSHLKRLNITGLEDGFLDTVMHSLKRVGPNLANLTLYTAGPMTFDAQTSRSVMEILSTNNPQIETLRFNIFRYRDPPQWSAAIIEPLDQFQCLRKLKRSYFDFTDFGVQTAFRILVVRLVSLELEYAIGLDWLYSNWNPDVYLNLQRFAVRYYGFQSPEIMAQFVVNKCPRLVRLKATFQKD